jgi:hypothetical protein
MSNIAKNAHYWIPFYLYKITERKSISLQAAMQLGCFDSKIIPYSKATLEWTTDNEC